MISKCIDDRHRFGIIQSEWPYPLHLEWVNWSRTGRELETERSLVDERARSVAHTDRIEYIADHSGDA